MPDAHALTLFVTGALAMGNAVVALFFARFWRRTGVALFGWFAAAFALLAVQRVTLVLIERSPGMMPWSYSIRLLGFLLILAGIWAQNRRAHQPAGGAVPTRNQR